MGIIAGPIAAGAAENWFEKGIEDLKAGRYDAAIKAFTLTIEVVPHDFQAFNNRGAAWFYKEKYHKAIADYTQALAINPSYAKAYHNRGSAWYYLNDYDHAMADYSKAIDIDPYYAEAFFSRGAIWLHRNQFDRARRDFENALEIKPEYPEAEEKLLLAQKLQREAAAGPAAPASHRPAAGSATTTAAAESTVAAAPKTESRPPPRRLAPPTPQRQPKKTTAQRSAQSRIRATVTPSRRLPYTIQVSSNRDIKKARSLVMRLRGHHYPAFMATAELPGKGIWHRVFVGPYVNRSAAADTIAALQSDNFGGAFLTEMAYSVLVALPSSDNVYDHEIGRLSVKGYAGFDIPRSRGADGKGIMVGAFDDPKQAHHLAKLLQADGFKARVVDRR